MKAALISLDRPEYSRRVSLEHQCRTALNLVFDSILDDMVFR